MNLLTKEEIEKFGFTYEPDETKCKTRKIKLHFDCNYYKDGNWTERNTPELTKEWKDGCGECLVRDAFNMPYLNRVFVPEVSPMSGEGVMCRWVMISGHGDALTDKWYKTGFLDGLKPNQVFEAASYLNRTAQELIERGTSFESGSAEYKRWDTITAIVLPVARTLYDKYPTPPDPTVLVEDVARFFDKHKELHEACNSYICSDGDKQIQELYVDHYGQHQSV